MKTKISYILICSLLISVLPVQEAWGQSWLQGIGQGVKHRAKDRAMQRVEDKIYQKVDQAVDKTVDKAFESTEKAVDKAVNKAVSATEKRVKAAADTLTAAAEAVAAAAEDYSVTVAESVPAATTSDTKALKAEMMKKFAGRPSGGMPFYPVKTGVVMTYASSTGKGKPTSYTRTTITDIRRKDDHNYTVVTSSEILDEDKNPVMTEPMTAGAIVEDGMVTYDPETMAGQLTEGMEITGDYFILPDNITIGDTFPNYSITVNIGGLNTVTENTDIIVTGRETLTVSGHKIDCYIIESITSVTALGFKTSMSQKVWYGRGIGQVKQEGYNKNGKLMSVYELVELSGF